MQRSCEAPPGALALGHDGARPRLPHRPHRPCARQRGVALLPDLPSLVPSLAMAGSPGPQCPPFLHSSLSPGFVPSGLVQ